ncbi:Acyl-CoA desaturase 1 [Trichoplax sp. H2]|uniref:Fatty acid desaturase domain-containing protein n=1 Tax=Trichoplax adhaerens TaxID=10228 RepID=B3SCI4_TRIAD|nr:hypothetical protein TRIADDRAFT_51148 [Trichoplax adhaerens]EDV19521.1 hypothetical protein TRIADDRAFT_51148 [Trichoplax adhaerens]RDD37389.1 Acyl-CoA desaturase 1 [Trichoplax sp. H2]|eukprot:XP_002117953.1 hypothetical protein TRIADDRAFT_51148 [Trichoplax adhaerens]
MGFQGSSTTTVSEVKNKATAVNDELPPLREQIIWKNVLRFGFFHVLYIKGLTLLPYVKGWSIVWIFVLHFFGSLGITAGVHRLWSHRSYKASTAMRIFLMLCNSMTYENSILHWARDHRVHHKFTDTNADPHSAGRGFFFSHIGWLLVKKNHRTKEEGDKINYDDLYQDKVVMFQYRYYGLTVLVCWLLFPLLVPMLAWQETFMNSLFVCVFLRHGMILHATYCINSFSHFFGMKPYDRHMKPTENHLTNFVIAGEGFHNYHHSFPYDYSASEFRIFNVSTLFIDFCAFLGLASHRRRVSPEAIKRRIQRTGDGSHKG